MIDDKTLKELYNSVLDEIPLTRQQLLTGCGFTQYDLGKLMDDGVITRIQRGLYKFNNIDSLYYYGKELIAFKQYDKATACFEICHKLDSTHLGACFQLFLRSIKNKDYNRAFELLDSLYKTSNEFYITDTNFYLYILSLITEVPDRYREKLNELTFEDIKVRDDDKRYQSVISIENEIRENAFKEKFSDALNKINEIKDIQGKIGVQDHLTRVLLIQAKNLNRNTIINFLKNEEYDDAIEYLVKKSKNNSITFLERYVLKLLIQYSRIIKDFKVPNKLSVESESIFEAIDKNDFNYALQLCTRKNKESNFSNENDLLYIVLNVICKKIKAIEEKKQSQNNQETKSTSQFEQINSDNLDVANKLIEKQVIIAEPVTIKENPNSISYYQLFAYLINSLLKNELDNAYLYLKKYMKSIGETKLEFLIIDLIKISQLDNDLTFIKVIQILTQINNGELDINITYYIKEFYMALSKNEFEKSRLYLDIIINVQKLGLCNFNDELCQVLLQSGELLENIRSEVLSIGKQISLASDYNQVIINHQDNESQLSLMKEVKSNILQIPNNNQLPSQIKVTNSNEDNSKIIKSEKLFIAKKHEELLANGGGIILLKSMDSDRIKRMLDILNEYKDIYSFVIIDDNKERIVLEFKKTGYVDIKNLFNLGNKAYRAKNYDSCIENYLEILHHLKKPQSFVYLYLGLSYMQKLQKYKPQLAINYLTIAYHLGKVDGRINIVDLLDLLLRLKGDISPEDSKPNLPSISEKEFNSEEDKYFYGILNFLEIDEYIFKHIQAFIEDEEVNINSNKTFKLYYAFLNVCLKWNKEHKQQITPSQIGIIFLIYAREYYSQGIYVMGKRFLEFYKYYINNLSFEDQLLTNKIYNEILRNKKLYELQKKNSKLKLLTKPVNL